MEPGRIHVRGRTARRALTQNGSQDRAEPEPTITKKLSLYKSWFLELLYGRAHSRVK